MRSLILLVIILLTSINVFAQLNYRTRASGDWGTPTVWQVETLPNVWVTASSSPDFAANNIQIRSGHSVTISANITLDQTTVRDGGSLLINDSITVTINNGIGNDFSMGAAAETHFLGEGHIAGNGSAILNGNLFVYSVNPTGAITSGTGSTGNIRILIRSYYSTTTVHYEGAGVQYIGNGQPPNSAIIINNLSGVFVNNTSSTLVELSGLIQVVQGTLTVGNNNFKSTSSIEVNGGYIQFINSASASRMYTLTNLSIVDGGMSILTTNGSNSVDLRVNGILNLQGDDLTLQSGGGNLILTINNDITGTNKISSSGSLNYLYINGSGNLTNPFPIAENSVLRTFRINRPGLDLEVPYFINLNWLSLFNGNITFQTDLSIQRDLNLAPGTSLDFSNQTLTLNGPVGNSFSGGTLISNSNSTLLLTGNTGASSALLFSGGSSLQLLTIDRPGVVTLSSELTITGTLNLTRPSLTNTGGISLSSGAVVNRNSTCSFSGLVPTGGPYSVNYSGTSMSTSIEAQGSLSNVSSSVTGILTLSNPISAVGNLTINSGTFTTTTNAISAGLFTNAGIFNAPTSTLTLSGNFTNNGTFNSGTGTVVFNGSSTQNIAGSNPAQFSNITLSNDASVSIESTQSLRGVLTLGADATFDADGSAGNSIFTVLSVDDIAGSDGSIAALPTGASVTGDITIQRYWSALDDVYRYISSPVANSPISQLQDSGIPITGGFSGTSFPCDGCDNDFINLGWYDETVTGYIWEGYQIMPSSGNDNSEELVPGRGYELYMWNGVNSTLWSTRGTANQGSYPLEVSRTLSSPPLSTEDGWNFVGNPYPSSIVWNDNTDLPGGWSMTNIDPVVWVWDVASEAWKFFDASDNSGDLAGGKISTGQAFWVYATGSSPSLTVHEAAKTSASGAYYRQRENTPSMLTITVAGNGLIKDNTYLTVGEETGYLNVQKFSRGVEAISLALLSEEGRRLARFSIAELVDEIPVSLVFKNEGEYEFSFTSTDESASLNSYYLIDRYMGKTTSIENSYSFTVTKNAQTFENRFYLSRNPEQNFTPTEEIAVRSYPNPTTSNLTVEVMIQDVQNISLTDNVGQVVRNNQVTYSNGIGSTQLEMTSLPKGLYYVKVVGTDRKVYIQKVIKQ